MSKKSIQVSGNRFELEGPNVENDAWFARLDPEHQGRINRFVDRFNAAFQWTRAFGIPESYSKRLAVLRQHPVFRRNLEIDAESLYALDQATAHAVYEQDVFGQIMSSNGLQVFTEKFRRNLKQYKISDLEHPAFTQAFRNPNFTQYSSDSSMWNGVGLQFGIQMSWIEQLEVAGGLWDPLVEIKRVQAERFGRQKNRRGWLGTSCQDNYTDDGGAADNWGIKGVMNLSSLQTFEAGTGADDDCTSFGDVVDSLRAALADLVKCYFAGPVVLVTTPGIFHQTLIERSTYEETTELDRIKEEFFETGLIDQWWLSNELKSAAPTTTTQQMLLFVANPAIIAQYITLPTQTFTMLTREYDQDIKENMVFYDIIRDGLYDTTENVFGATVAADITVDSTGYMRPGRVL